MSNTQAPPRTPRPPRQAQQRVVQQPGKGGATGGAGGGDEAAASAAGKKKKLIAIAVVLLVAAGAAYWFLVASKPKEPAEPVPGPVVALESTSINLAQGHYLRIGIALQTVESGGGGHGGSDGPDGSQAKDLTIALFSGKSKEELSKPAEREKLKAELRKQIAHAYHDEVMDIYFHEFVMQ